MTPSPDSDADHHADHDADHDAHQLGRGPGNRGCSRGGHDAQPHPQSISVVVIDDHTLFARSLLLVLREAGMCATALPVREVDTLWASPGGRDADRNGLPGGSCPGLVLLDLDLGTQPETGARLSGVELISDLRGCGWHVLVLTGSEDQAHLAAAIAAGAMGVVEKTDDFERLLDAAQVASTGKSLITEDERARWVALDARYNAEKRERVERLSKLTPREREVLELIAEGCRAAAIASHFVVSISTVRAQIRAVLAKTKSSSQLEAAALLRESSLDQ